MKTSIRTCFAAAAFAAATGVQAQSAAGSWTGKLRLGSNSLTIVLHLSKDSVGKWQCKMDSPDQGAKGIPAVVAVATDDSMAVAAPLLAMAYNGKITGDSVVGTFSQAGRSIPLSLSKGEEKPIRPQEPRRPFPYSTEEVSFHNPADGALFSGILTLPQKPADGFPAVVMVNGSGQQDRDCTLFDHKPFLVLADFLARRGIASLRYDDRGLGGSRGGTDSLTTDVVVADAAAAAGWLASHGGFGKIGILGHSEGGFAAVSIAAAGKADFAVSIAGPALRGDSIIAMQIGDMIRAGGNTALGDSAQALATDFIAYRKEHTGKIPTKDMLLSFAADRGKKVDSTYAIIAVLAQDNKWLEHFISAETTPAICGAKAPVMAVYGGNDLQVRAADNSEAMLRKLPANPHNVVKVYPGLNHLMQHCGTGLPTEYRKTEETFSAEVMEDIAKWINSIAVK